MNLTTGQKMGVAAVGFISFLPIFRSGGREDLNFWQWIWNHTIWGPPVEYIPEEDYEAALMRISSFSRERY